MLVSYNKKSSRDFSFLGKVDCGTKYPRIFWKEISSGRPVCYWAISNQYNKQEMKLVHSEISDRITSVSFGERCKKDEEPKWKLTGIDENGIPKAEIVSHADMVEAIIGSELLELPFKLGENFWKRHLNIESSTPKGSELSRPSKSLF